MSEDTSNALLAKIARLIEAGGPMSLADYMHLCMADPQSGYYTTRNAIGGDTGPAEETGDFITAPEVSQMFGELIGIWCIAAWQAMDRPSVFTLVEAGPGKGTLMADVLRAARQMPDFLSAADVLFIENSAKLAEAQRNTLSRHQGSVRSMDWAGSLTEMPDQPAILIANEFLDVLPFRQYAKTETAWREVGIILDEDGNLTKGATATVLERDRLPAGAADEPTGAIFEIAPAREAIVEQIGRHISANGGAALLIDYGHTESGFGDTFQAIRNHQHADPLHDPGEYDLTSHVDFASLRRTAATIEGIQTAIMTQGEFLLALGLLERAGALGSGKDEATQDTIRRQVERLAAPEQMGQLFKVMAIFPKGIHLPAFT